jgi:hypothetical protein
MNPPPRMGHCLPVAPRSELRPHIPKDLFKSLNFLIRRRTRPVDRITAIRMASSPKSLRKRFLSIGRRLCLSSAGMSSDERGRICRTQIDSRGVGCAMLTRGSMRIGRGYLTK